MEVGERDRRRRGDGAEASSSLSLSLRRSIVAPGGGVPLCSCRRARAESEGVVYRPIWMDPEGWTVGWIVHPVGSVEGVVDFLCLGIWHPTTRHTSSDHIAHSKMCSYNVLFNKLVLYRDRLLYDIDLIDTRHLIINSIRLF
jgi:hypothetical protein